MVSENRLLKLNILLLQLQYDNGDKVCNFFSILPVCLMREVSKINW